MCSCPPEEQRILEGNTMWSKWDFNRSLSRIDQWLFHTSWLALTFFNGSVTLHTATCEKTRKQKMRSVVKMAGQRQRKQSISNSPVPLKDCGVKWLDGKMIKDSRK